MACGFLILNDGRCLSVRHACHDAVLRSIAAALSECPLRTWLQSQVPTDADMDFGYAFIRAADEEHVSRVLDLRCLTDENRRLFEAAARSATPVAGPFAPVEDVSYALDRLRAMLERCDNGEPPLTLSDWINVAPPPKGKIGPGWDTLDSFP